MKEELVSMTIRSKRMTTSRAVVATFLSFSFMIYPLVRTIPAVEAAVDMRSESQMKTEAGLYDSAMREIERALTIKLETIDDLKAANALLAKQIPNLRFNRSKLAQIGLSDSTFVAAVRERTKDSKTTDAFVREVATDSKAITKLTGALSLSDRMQRKVDGDVALIRKLADRLNQVAADLKAKIKQNHVSGRNGKLESTFPRHEFFSTVINPRSGPPTSGISGSDVELVLEIVAIYVFPGVLIGLAVLAAGPVSLGVVVAGAALVIGRVVENFGTDKGRDRVAQCQDAVEATYKSCVAGGAGACCGLAEINAAGCLAQWLFEAGACILA
jgi:hypothetical protein